MPAKKGTKKNVVKKDIVETASEKVKKEKVKKVKAVTKEVKVEKKTAEKVIEKEIKFATKEKIVDQNNFNGEDESLNIVERFVRFEAETKIGIISSLVLIFAIIFSWDWINTTWWLILIIAAVSLKTLHSQSNDLEEDKPFESKMSRLFFIGTIILLVIRDLVITSRLDNWLDYM
ncbi:MAG: hypothetical protein KAS62_01465 [Candidatus Delongbacteria bacterium]|nr:hypothetical protein [Candidatus Delongbacteria bacterium]